MKDFRSICPISCGLDILGDKWTLLIIRDMIMFGKSTFKEFSESDEHIATNILSSRLKTMEKSGLIKKGKLEGNKKVNVYTLTEKGLGLLPVILEMTLWSDEHMRSFKPDMYAQGIEQVRGKKELVIEQLRTAYMKRIDMHKSA
jgi:DNA-binding HxlR family transcriptional regulator